MSTKSEFLGRFAQTAEPSAGESGLHKEAGDKVSDRPILAPATPDSAPIGGRWVQPLGEERDLSDNDLPHQGK